MQHLQQANAAGQATPINENGRIFTAAASGNNSTDADSRHPSTTAQPDCAKQLATLTARCALAGVTLIETTDDYGRPAYVVTRWAQCRQFESLDDVREWLAQVTGVAA